MDIRRIGEVVKLVAVYCPNIHNLHKGMYIRYAILVNRHGEATWIDDPSEDDLARLWARVSSKAEAVTAASECPFCQAVSGKTKSS